MACVDSVKAFLFVSSGDGYGYGDGSGDGSGSGYGYGSGDGSGYGSGDGSGSGSGSGSGYGYGYGSGSGSGSGSGDGSGYGYGYGYGVASYNNQPVYMVDGVPTLITSVKGNVAMGHILNADLTTTKAYVAKVGDEFAHGKTIGEALRDATAKHEENLPAEERIDAFLVRFPVSQPHLGSELFEGHRMLTGSCLQGREQFVKDHGIDLTQRMTLEEFCALTRNAYGSEVIQALEQRLQQGEAN